MEDKVIFTSVKPNSSGNPRVVCHFLKLVNEADEKKAVESSDLFYVPALYTIALRKAAKIGGRKFHNKQFGGGIVFTASARSIDDLRAQIAEIKSQIG